MPKKKLPSGSENKLARLSQEYEAIKAQFQALGYVLPGSVQKRLYRCGKPNCRCATEGILHGPYYQWTRKIGGKTVNLNLDLESVERVQEWIKNNRNLRTLCHRLQKTSLDMLRASKTLDKT